MSSDRHLFAWKVVFLRHLQLSTLNYCLLHTGPRILKQLQQHLPQASNTQLSDHQLHSIIGAVPSLEMAPPQGLNGSIHAPPSSTNGSSSQNDNKNSGIQSSKFNPANAPTFTPAFLPINKPTFATPPLATGTSPPSNPLDRIEQRNEALVVKSTTQPPTEERQPAKSKSLRLGKAILIDSSSTLPNFSVDAILLQRTGQGESFSVYVLAAGIIQDCSVSALNIYLDAFPREVV
jgi:hypothetical protein